MRLITVMMLMMFMLVSGCRAMQPVEHSDWSSLEGRVAVGDTVEVVTTDGRVEKFVVTEVTADALVGADTRIARQDISRLQVKAVLKGRTFGAAFGSAGAVLLIVLAATMASLLGGGWTRGSRPTPQTTTPGGGRASGSDCAVGYQPIDVSSLRNARAMSTSPVRSRSSRV